MSDYEIKELIQDLEEDILRVVSSMIDEARGEGESEATAAFEDQQAKEHAEAPMIDSTGRIYVDGHQVGWIKKDTYPVALQQFADAMGAHLPSTHDMRKVEEIA